MQPTDIEEYRPLALSLLMYLFQLCAASIADFSHAEDLKKRIFLTFKKY